MAMFNNAFFQRLSSTTGSHTHTRTINKKFFLSIIRICTLSNFHRETLTRDISPRRFSSMTRHLVCYCCYDVRLLLCLVVTFALWRRCLGIHVGGILYSACTLRVECTRKGNINFTRDGQCTWRVVVAMYLARDGHGWKNKLK